VRRTKPQKFKDPEDFFYRRAGYGYDPARESEEEGRRRGARALAEAEEVGTALGLTEEWEEDQDPDRSFMDQDGYTRRDRECAEFYACVVRDAEGVVRASLCGIHEDTRDPIGSRYYRRVVRAELFAEALAEIAREVRA
jgi:hypothetical protein